MPRLGLLVFVITAIFTFFSSEYTITSIPEYVVGDIASSDIVVPVDIPVKDEEATNLRQKAAKEAVLPVYQYKESRSSGIIKEVSATFLALRNKLNSEELEKAGRSGLLDDNRFPELELMISRGLGQLIPEAFIQETTRFLVRNGFSKELELLVAQLLEQVDRSFVIDTERDLIRDRGRIHVLLDVSGKERLIEVEQILTLQQLGKKVNIWMSEMLQDSDIYQAGAFMFVSKLLVSNLTFDLQATESMELKAIKNVDLVFTMLKKGKVIVRQGDEIQRNQLKQIEAIRSLPKNPSSVNQTVGRATLIASLLLIFGYIFSSLCPTNWNFLRLALLASTVMVVQTLFLKGFWFICEALSQNFVAFPYNDKGYFFFALPFALGAMLVTILVDERLALILSVFSSILAALLLGGDVYDFIYVLISNFIGILTVRRAMQRVGFIGAGVKLGLVASGVFIILQNAQLAPFNLSAGLFGAALALFSGPLNTGLLVFLLPIFERLFMVTTIMRLLELGNINLPLIRELILKAPGTYSHSVAVGTLSEGAAKSIGLNPVFARIACLYHDIGKSIHPEYFVENQQGSNIHDQISPQRSVRIVVEHVTEGIRMAQAANLPSNMVEIIPQHHGTRRLTYFYEKAVDSTKDVRDDNYRYPGPKPQSKMAAVIMLADAVEATARTLTEHSQELLLEVIQKIVKGTIEDGQLSECDITLADIDSITFSFLETLSSIYHVRISYPGFEFNRKSFGSPKEGGEVLRT